MTHDAREIASIDNFVSINSEVGVDGQVNAEVAAGRQISGPGGAVDLMRGARQGGRSFRRRLAEARQMPRTRPSQMQLLPIRSEP